MPQTWDDEAETLLNPSALSDSMIKELHRLTPTPPEPIPAMRECDMELLPAYAPSSYPPPAVWPAQPYPSMPPTVRVPRKRATPRAKSRLHWVVVAMAAAISAGLYFDPPARLNAKTALVANTTHVIAMLPKHR